MRNRTIALTMTMVLSLSSLTACSNQTTLTETQSEQTSTEIETEPISTEIETELNTSSHEDETTETEFIEGIDTSTTDTSTSEANDTAEIMQSKWADINGAWDAVHQFTLYAREQGADDTDGWCWEYYKGKGAGDQPSYAVYMKEGSPDYGKIFYVGEYLPDGSQFCGTNDEWEAFIGEDLKRVYEDAGYEVTEEDGAYVIHLD